MDNNQHNHVIPPTTERPDTNFQPDTPTQYTNVAIPDCSCQRCSDARRVQLTYIEQGDQQRVNNAVASYVNQNQGPDNLQGIAPVRSGIQFATPAEIIWDNIGYAPIHERAGPSNTGLHQAPTLDASIAEGRRRLADLYLNNASAYVSMIRLEPGPSGRFQVIITLEIPNIL